MVKIAIIDDHKLFRVGLAAILKKEPNFTVAGEYKDFQSVKPIINTLDVNLVLADISLEKESGFDAAKYIKTVRPSLKVVILSSHKEEFYITNALKADIDGYIHKNSHPQELIKGIKKVMKGEKFFSEEISSVLINMHHKPAKGVLHLTPKEKRVALYLAEGYSIEDISEKLNITLRTAEAHQNNILKKFGLKNSAELIKKIIEKKIRL